MNISPALRTALSGCAVRLHMLSVPIGVETDAVAAVAVAKDPSMATPDALLAGSPTTVNAAIVLPAGHSRPDALGEAYMAAVIKEGGAAFLMCERLADALKATEWCRAAAGGGA